jgi:ABC-type uncharacterized transport system substrate-binding protein
MSETDRNRSPQPPFGIRALQTALALGAFLLWFVLPQPASAQSDSGRYQSSLVYIADSENQRLNRRMRELLSDALGDSVMIRTFNPGQTSQDSESPVIALGPAAFAQVRQENRRVPVLGLLVGEAYFRSREEAADGVVSAVYSSPPLIRQIAIGKTILPHSTRVAMLARPETEQLYGSVMSDLEKLGMEGRLFLVPSDERLIPTLIRALNYGDFVLAAQDDTIYNPRTIKHILLTAYRRNRIVIGPGQAYVKAGSLASSFTPLSEVARMASDYIRHFRQQNEFPPPAHPDKFGIEVNRQVGRSLNIPLPERDILLESVIERLENAEGSDDE